MIRSCRHRDLKRFYERDIRARVEADHHGEIVSIDMDSGTWAVGEDILDAVDPAGAASRGNQCLVPAGRLPGGAQVRRQVLGDRPVIPGTVNASYEVVGSLTVQGPSGLTRQIEAEIDTVFTGFLSLPPALVPELSINGTETVSELIMLDK